MVSIWCKKKIEMDFLIYLRWGARENTDKHKANMIETQTTVNPPKQEEVPNKDSERFPGNGKKSVVR